MRPISGITKQVIIWLLFSWISLVVLAPAHSLTHIPEGDDSSNAHCSLCVHQHQVNTGIISASLQLPLVEPVFLSFAEPQHQNRLAPVFHYQSRGPPPIL